MNLKRLIDRYCFGFINFFFDCRSTAKQYNKEKIKHIDSIAVVKLIGMGDAVLQLPTIEIIKKKYPYAKIDLWTTSATAPVFHNQKFIDKVYQIQLKNLFLFFEKIGSYNLVIDFEPFMNFSFLLARLLVNSKVTIFNSIGFESSLRKVKHPISKKFIHQFHMVNNYFHLIENFINQDQEKKIIQNLSLLHGSETHQKMALEIEKYPYPDKKKRVAIAIGAGKVARGRKLPLQTYIEVIEKILHCDKEFRIILIGGNLEKKDSLKVMEYFFKKKISLADKIINLVAEIPLGVTFELMKNIPYFIGNDTGTAHIALAQKCKSIVIFGPETEKRYGPLNTNSIVINKNLQCSPCIEIWKGKNKTCNNPICTKSITAEEVFEKFCKIADNI